ncbi:MAG TPA: MerR family DNA-binding transcriptional regulator [Stellaceae bacterium]
MQNGEGGGIKGEGSMYSIGKLANEFAVSPRAIRFYEDQGLLAPQRVGGNRVYGARDRARLKLILRGKRLGFSLSDISELLDLYDVDPAHETQLRATLKKGRDRIAELEQQLAEIATTLQELRDIEALLAERLRQREEASRPTAADDAASQRKRTTG